MLLLSIFSFVLSALKELVKKKIAQLIDEAEIPRFIRDEFSIFFTKMRKNLLVFALRSQFKLESFDEDVLN